MLDDLYKKMSQRQKEIDMSQDEFKVPTNTDIKKVVSSLVILFLVFGIMTFILSLFQKPVSVDEDLIRKYEAEHPKDLGMTFEQFKIAYEEEVVKNDLPSVSMSNINVKNYKDNIFCYFSNVVMTVGVDKTSGNINSITVTTDPLEYPTKSERTYALLQQSEVWSLAAMVFDPDMEQQDYRESILKKLYSIIQNNSTRVSNMVEGNARYRADQKRSAIYLILEAKDLPK